MLSRRIRRSAIPLACALWVAPRADVPSLVQAASAPVSPASSDLATYLDNHAVDTQTIARFAGAARLLREGKLGESQHSFRSVALSAPALADWAYLLAADAAARLGDTAAAREHLASGSQWLARERGWRVRVRGLEVAPTPLGAASLALA
ncbi:MAG: hypothetical protein WEE89_01920, partial [Gemmatimonadota bacterium]